jgi:predicted PurR-regulated permease PerM
MCFLQLLNLQKTIKIFSWVLLLSLFLLAPSYLAAAPQDQGPTQQSLQSYKNSLLKLVDSTEQELINSQKDLEESKKIIQELNKQLTTALEQSSQASDLVIQSAQQIAAQKVILEQQSNYSNSLEQRLKELNKELNAQKTTRIFNDVGFTLAGFILGAILSWVYFCGSSFGK